MSGDASVHAPSEASAPAGARGARLLTRLQCVRRFTEALCAPLFSEDYVLQSMPDASPPKWHLAHTSWFFETFVLCPHRRGYRRFREGWDYLFNSYYETLGPRHPRPARGLLTRPTCDEVYAYRHVVDDELAGLLGDEDGLSQEVLDLIELGLQHEQQHQELLLSDLQHGLSCNPLRPRYREGVPARAMSVAEPGWIEHPGGLHSIGHASDAGEPGTAFDRFAFDNESPAHRVYLEPFALASRAVTSGEYAEFIADGGYRRAELWLSDGWSSVCAEGWQAPLYWEERDGNWCRFSLYSSIDVDPLAPVCHVSFFEAEAFARWAGYRLPSEAEWELCARDLPQDGQFVEDGALVPLARPLQRGVGGGVWNWTSSPYASYPGYARPAGAIGEYNAKFMVNQMVLRGGSCFSPRSHLRPSYRNFFPPQARWQVSGIRLARTQ